MIYTVLCLLVLGPSLTVYVSEGCGRVPATPAPTLSPQPTEGTLINGTYRSYVCTKNETRKTGCLNGGSCFVFLLQESRVPSCHCTVEYRGTRCEELNIDVLFPSTDQGHVAAAGASIAVGVAVVCVIIFISVVVCKKRRAKRKQAQAAANNGTARPMLPENHTPPRSTTMNHYGNGNHVDLQRTLLTNDVNSTNNSVFTYKNTPV